MCLFQISSIFKLKVPILFVCLTCWNALLTNLWMSEVLPTRLSPATTTVHWVSLANFMFVILTFFSTQNLFLKLGKKSLKEKTYILNFFSLSSSKVRWKTHFLLFSLKNPVFFSITFDNPFFTSLFMLSLQQQQQQQHK